MPGEDPAIRLWAERVVELYASRIRLTLVEQGQLERSIASCVRTAAAEGRVPEDWPSLANTALEEWEQSRRERGPRVQAFAGRSVVEKRRAL